MHLIINPLHSPELRADGHDLVPGLVPLAQDGGLLLDKLLLRQLARHQLLRQLRLGQLVFTEGPDKKLKS